MKRIELEDDLYTYLLQNMKEFGESPSSVLRRLLGINQIDQKNRSIGTPPKPGLDQAGKSELEIHLSSIEFQYSRGVVGKFLSVLGIIYQSHADDFHQVESIKGRGRLYFSRDVTALTQAGSNVNPKQIPNSPYWVITTTPTDLKQEILTSVMRVFNYPGADIRTAVAAIAD